MQQCRIKFYALTMDAMQRCTDSANGVGLKKALLPVNTRSPVYCPAHNIQRGDYIRQYYRSRRRQIPQDVLARLASNPSNVDTSDINARLEPGIRTAQRSAAIMGPGVREHERAQRAVAREGAFVPEHASARQAAAREDIAGTSMSKNSSNAVPKQYDCSICTDPIDLNERNSIMRTQCNHIFHPICLERWMEEKVRFLIWFLQRWRIHLLLTEQQALTIVALFPCLS